jgi:hypothetical protein
MLIEAIDVSTRSMPASIDFIRVAVERPVVAWA